MPGGVEVYGGFDATEVDFSERDPAAHVTILSGDISQNDVDLDGNSIAETPADIDNSGVHNSYRVVFVAGGMPPALAAVDGFTVTAGHAEGGSGAGIHAGSAVLANLVCSGNGGAGYGGGIFGGSVHLRNSKVTGNAAVQGGGVFASGDIVAINVDFVGNEAQWGGGLSLWGGGSVENGLFRGNRATHYGGGGMLQIQINSFDPVSVVNSTFSGNHAVLEFGGGIRSYLGAGQTMTITNSILWNNRDSSGTGTLESAIWNRFSSRVTIAHSDIQMSGGSGGSWNPAAGVDGGNNLDADPLFYRPLDPAAAPVLGGDYHFWLGSPVENAGDNAAVTWALDLDGHPRILDGTVSLGPCEVGYLFADGFESGNTSAWSAVVP